MIRKFIAVAAFVGLVSAVSAESYPFAFTRFVSSKSVSSNSTVVPTLVTTNLTGFARVSVSIYNPGDTTVTVYASATNTLPIAKIATLTSTTFNAGLPETSVTTSVPAYYVGSVSNATSSVIVTEHWTVAPSVAPTSTP
ncbi:MAG: hypothetical protein WCS70_09020 [Verrucomicrobiota bacterium]